MTRLVILSIALLLPASLLSQPRTATPQTGTPRRAVDTTSPATRILEHVKYLSSEKLAGRRTGTPENMLAAKYISDNFRRLGLKPLPKLKDYYHNWNYLAGFQVGKKNKLDIRTPSGTKRWVADKNFKALSYSGQGRARGPLVFVGYGITAPELEYDDYAGLDVKGKVVMIMTYSPDGANPHGQFARHSTIVAKLRQARSHGAAGVILINPPLDSTSGTMRAVFDRAFTGAGLPVLFATRNVIADIRDSSGRTLADLQRQIDASRKPASLIVDGYSVDMVADVQLVRKRVPNVLGMIPGNDPKLKHEIVVIGGHFDHLGNGGEGSLHAGHVPAIHYGADDNASGTAGVLWLAERFMRTRDNRRTIVFAAFNGEEEGLLGSDTLAKNFPYPIENVVAMVNMDMIGRLDSNKLIVQGTGTSPGWELLVERVNVDKLTLKYTKDGYGPSDHSSFYMRGVPVLVFFTGLHKDYHRPSDTWEKVNYEGEVKILRLAESAVRSLDSNDARPPFTKVQNSAQGRSNSGFSVYVGSIPDYAFEGEGLRLNGVTEGGPAAKAGLKEGDIIVRMGTISINNIYDYTDALSSFKAGDEVETEFVRDGKKQTTKITMGKR